MIMDDVDDEYGYDYKERQDAMNVDEDLDENQEQSDEDKTKHGIPPGGFARGRPIMAKVSWKRSATELRDRRLSLAQTEFSATAQRTPDRCRGGR